MDEPVQVELPEEITSRFQISVSSDKDVNLQQGGALAVSAGRDLSVSMGGSAVMAVGRDAQVSQGGADIMMIGGNAQIEQGGAVIMNAQQVSARDSFFGMVIAKETHLEGDSRVLLNTPQALAFGAALGTVFALVSWLLRRR